MADPWPYYIYLTRPDRSLASKLFARININPGKNDVILMAGFVESDTDTTPSRIMMMMTRMGLDSPARLGDDHLCAVPVELLPQLLVLQGHLHHHTGDMATEDKF